MHPAVGSVSYIVQRHDRSRWSGRYAGDHRRNGADVHRVGTRYYDRADHHGDYHERRDQRTAGGEVPARRPEWRASPGAARSRSRFRNRAASAWSKRLVESVEFIHLRHRNPSRLPVRRCGLCNDSRDAGDGRGSHDRHAGRQRRRHVPVHLQEGHHEGSEGHL